MKKVLLFFVGFLWLAQLKSSTQVATEPKTIDHNKFLKVLRSIPQEEMIVFKKLASEILTGDKDTFIVNKEPKEWNEPIRSHFQEIIGAFNDTEQVKQKALTKLGFMTKFLLSTLEEQDMTI